MVIDTNPFKHLGVTQFNPILGKNPPRELGNSSLNCVSPNIIEVIFALLPFMRYNRSNH
jgi:hypothetical protein